MEHPNVGRRKEAAVIISYRDLAMIRQREIAERAEKRRLEVHARRPRPAHTRVETINTTSARAA